VTEDQTSRRGVILVAEDDEQERYIAAAVLNYGGYEVHEAASAEDVVTLAEEIRPDLVILDLMFFGKASGVDALDALRQSPNTREIPVLAFSSYVRDFQRRLSELPFTALLSKPATPTELLDAVAGLIGPPGSVVGPGTR
jgi:two-component system cell cycle sensor histidine kinase/response regulator CckA